MRERVKEKGEKENQLSVPLSLHEVEDWDEDDDCANCPVTRYCSLFHTSFCSTGDSITSPGSASGQAATSLPFIPVLRPADQEILRSIVFSIRASPFVCSPDADDGGDRSCRRKFLLPFA